MRGLVIRAFSGPRTFAILSHVLAFCRPDRSLRNCLPVFTRAFGGFPRIVPDLVLPRNRFELTGYRVHFLTARLKWCRTEDYVGRFGDREYFDAAETSPWQK